MQDSSFSDVRGRLEREAAFHDRSYIDNVRAEADKFYSITVESRAFHHDRLTSAIQGKRVLEYGCGTGWNAVALAGRGAHVTGIDISPAAIEIARQTAEAHALTHRTAFHVMNAEELTFPDASFDMVCGIAILHHLDLQRSFTEIARVLSPDGVAVFTEPLGHNPLINRYRNRTPHLRTEDEHPLRMSDIQLARRHIRRVDVRYFHLLSLAAVPLRSTPLFRPVLAVAGLVDRVLLARQSPLKRWAWIVVIEMRK